MSTLCSRCSTSSVEKVAFAQTQHCFLQLLKILQVVCLIYPITKKSSRYIANIEIPHNRLSMVLWNIACICLQLHSDWLQTWTCLASYILSPLSVSISKITSCLFSFNLIVYVLTVLRRTSLIFPNLNFIQLSVKVWSSSELSLLLLSSTYTLGEF